MCKSSLHKRRYIFILQNCLKHFYIMNRNYLLYKQRAFHCQHQVSTPKHRIKRTREPDSLTHCHLCQKKNLRHPFLQLIMLVCKFPCRYKPITVFILFIKYIFNQSIMLGVIYHCSMLFKFFLQVNFHLLDKRWELMFLGLWKNWLL